MCGAANSTEDVHASTDASRCAPFLRARPQTFFGRRRRQRGRARGDARGVEGAAGRDEERDRVAVDAESAAEGAGAAEDRPALAHRCGVFPDVTPKLAENNPPVAAELLLCLARDHPAPSHNLPAHFDALVSMPTSLHSMEVVNRLVSEASELLPDDFVRAYVAECISAYRWSRSTGAGTSPGDTAGRRALVGVGSPLGNALARASTGSRMVRLVCMFLQLLVRRGASGRDGRVRA